MEVGDVDETCRRISAYPGVTGIIVTTLDGTVVRTSLDNSSTQQYVNCMRPLEERCASAVRDVDPTNQLHYVRLRSKRFEIMLKTDGDYRLYVIQSSSEMR